jgi:DNA-binding GntR family transcriptional regulator
MQSDAARADAIPPSLPVYLAERIADEIETNALKPGERLSEEAIAKRFGVSRAPVREALRLLAQEEIVAIEPRRGARVRSYSRAELSEMFEMRAVLYGLGVELFAQRATPEMIAIAEQLGRKVQSIGTSRDVTGEGFAAATQAVTSHLIGNCGNARLIDIFRKMTRRSFRHFAILAHSTPAHRDVVMAYVQPMLSAIARREDRAAGALGRDLVERNHAEVLRHLAEAGEDAGQPVSSV